MTGILQPTVRFDDFERISRGHQDLREQRIRIERDRCKQLVELFGFEDPRGFGFGFGRRCFRREGGYRGTRVLVFPFPAQTRKLPVRATIAAERLLRPGRIACVV
jgi:hypothetical protein